MNRHHSCLLKILCLILFIIIAPFIVSCIERLSGDSISIAIKKRDLEMMKRALARDPSQANADLVVMSPLMFSIVGDWKEGVELLLQNGANVNYQIPDRMNAHYLDAALHIAIRNRQYDFIRILLDHGADVNIKNKNGITPVEFSKSDPVAFEIFRAKGRS